MRRRHLFVIHKVAGLAGGFVLGLLAITGFFLDHENFDFLWRTTIDDRLLPESVISKKSRAVEAYRKDPANARHILVGTRRGLYSSFNGGKSFRRVLADQVVALCAHGNDWQALYAATPHGIYFSGDRGEHWRPFALAGENVTAINAWRNSLYAVVAKRDLYRIDAEGRPTPLHWQPPSPAVLPKQITLGRLVRDLHYGRGLFDGDLSLFVNDGLAFVLAFLSISGYVIYLKIRARRLRHKRHGKKDGLRFWVRIHAHGFQLVATLLLFLIFGVTGVFLDHAGTLRGFLHSVHLKTHLLPPVYRSLATDVWGFDYDGTFYRIGNRLGVFASSDLVHWQLESQGFAWRMKRLDDRLVVSGMGSPNRILAGDHWQVLKDSPHMPRDFYLQEGELRPVAPHHAQLPLPSWSSTSLYHLLLGLHDGQLVWGQWVWLNDLAALALLLLLYSGYLKWLYHRRRRSR